jgi:Mg2+ and Co2+ transporter CorA
MPWWITVFQCLNAYGDILEDLELSALENPVPDVLLRIHRIKRELALLRRLVWPMRELADQLYREEGNWIADSARRIYVMFMNIRFNLLRSLNRTVRWLAASPTSICLPFPIE